MRAHVKEDLRAEWRDGAENRKVEEHRPNHPQSATRKRAGRPAWWPVALFRGTSRRTGSQAPWRRGQPE